MTTRSTIVEVAARRLRELGPEAVTTRAVAEEAGVQAPTIYRLFGDKDGLMDAVAEHVMDVFVAAKAEVVRAAAAADVDPVDDLRAGWRSQVEFGLANPALFALLSDPRRLSRSPAAQAGQQVLVQRIRRIAAAGRLRVAERLAVGMVQAAGVGAVQLLLATPPEARDPGLAEAMLTAVLDHVLVATAPPADDHRAALAVAFRATTADLPDLTDAERALLEQWLDRVIPTLAHPESR